MHISVHCKIMFSWKYRERQQYNNGDEDNLPGCTRTIRSLERRRLDAVFWKIWTLSTREWNKGWAKTALVGAQTFRLLKNLVAPKKPSEQNLVAPKKPGELTYTEVKQKLTAHFKPKPITIAERFRFYKRQQRQGESMADYVAELRRLATACEFGAFLDDALRDKFVCGLQNENIQRRLLSEADLELKKDRSSVLRRL